MNQPPMQGPPMRRMPKFTNNAAGPSQPNNSNNAVANKAPNPKNNANRPGPAAGNKQTPQPNNAGNKVTKAKNRRGAGLTKGQKAKNRRARRDPYAMDAPYVNDEVREEHRKKDEIMNEMKGKGKNDELFAKFKEQREAFVKKYDEVKAAYLAEKKVSWRRFLISISMRCDLIFSLCVVLTIFRLNERLPKPQRQLRPLRKLPQAMAVRRARLWQLLRAQKLLQLSQRRLLSQCQLLKQPPQLQLQQQLQRQSRRPLKVQRPCKPPLKQPHTPSPPDSCNF